MTPSESKPGREQAHLPTIHEDRYWLEMYRVLHRLKKLVSGTLFLIARSRLGGVIVGWSFAHMSSIMPVDKLFETDHVVAFYHPKPSHPVHVLIVPKHAIKSILSIGEQDASCILDVISAAQHVVKLLKLEESGYRLIVNGGSYQDVNQVHFHLVSGNAPNEQVCDEPDSAN